MQKLSMSMTVEKCVLKKIFLFTKRINLLYFHLRRQGAWGEVDLSRRIFEPKAKSIKPVNHALNKFLIVTNLTLLPNGSANVGGNKAMLVAYKATVEAKKSFLGEPHIYVSYI